MFYLGLGKNPFQLVGMSFSQDARKAWVPARDRARSLRSEFCGKKAVGVWPEGAIRALRLGQEPIQIAENRDVHSPAHQEDALDRTFPFYSYLAREGLARYSRHFNQGVEFVTHHRSHAMAAVAMSPFDKCILVLVMDGAGSQRRDFPPWLAADERIDETLTQDLPTRNARSTFTTGARSGMFISGGASFVRARGILNTRSVTVPASCGREDR